MTTTTTALSRTFERRTEERAAYVVSARQNLASRATNPDSPDVDELVRAVHEVARAIGQHEAWKMTAPIAEFYGENTRGASEAITRELTDALLDGPDDQQGNRRNDAVRAQFDGFRVAVTEIFSLLNLSVR